MARYTAPTMIRRSSCQKAVGTFVPLLTLMSGAACAPTVINETPLPSSPITAILHAPAQVHDGYVLWHQSDELENDVDNITILTDTSGALVHTWPSTLTGGGTPGYLLADGHVARTGRRDVEYARRGPLASVDMLQVVDKDGEIVWEVSSQDLGDLFFHHDIEPMPNGNFLVTTYRSISADDARDLGWESMGAPQVWTDGIVEIRPDFETGASEVVWSWEVSDHLVQDISPTLDTYGAPSDHPQRIDPNFPTNYAPRNSIRQHVNSIDYNAELDQILISSFIYDEIWIIDHSTTTEEANGSTGGRYGRGGDLLYRFGNPAAYGHGTMEDRVFLNQHDANWIEEGLPGAGNILVHDNNTMLRRRVPGDGVADEIPQATNEGASSQVYELALPLRADGSYHREENAAFTAEIVWLWESPDYFADFQGGARRLPTGGVFLTDTTDHIAVELNAEGEIIAEYHGSAPAYKAFKHAPAEVDGWLDR